MTPTQIALARHALGLDGRRLISFRNRFITGGPSKDHDEWNAMVSAGMARVRRNIEIYGGDDFFALTETGAKAALKDGESLCSEDFPKEATQ